MRRLRNSTRRPANPSEPNLQRRYAALCARYRALAKKYEAETIRMSNVTRLAIAAMRAGTTALAAIDEGRYVVRNDRWLRLASERRAEWRLPGKGGGAHAVSLEGVALAQAEELLRSRETARGAQYERADGEMVVNLHLERTQGPPALVLALISDVTERVRSERELARMKDALEAQERLRAVGELASGIAHDLNNTLHALQLRLSRLSGCVAGSEHAEDLRVVERIAADAGARVRRLQDLAHRRADVPDERVDLRAVVADAVALTRPDASEPARHLAIEVALPELPEVMGNASELGHVFVNLFLNAKDAMPGGGGRIAVTGGVTPGGDVEIAVTDQGCGIPAENLKRVFDPFFTTKGGRGTGLGLSVAGGVMRRLGGSIRAENRPGGGGAAFTLRFPPAPSAPPERAASRRPGAMASRRVLVVDDDPDNLEAMQLVLAQHGHHVEVTESGLDAVARVEAGERYDVVLCDLGLRDTTGWEVASRIGASAPGTQVLLVTGWAEEIPADDPRRRHVVRVLSKPLGVDELREILGEPEPAPREPREQRGGDARPHPSGSPSPA